MEQVTDWIRLWRELVEATSEREQDSAGKAERGAHKLNRRWAKSDSTQDFIVAQLDTHPGSTLLDIGAGTGRWAILLSRHVRQVTAIDPSPTMLQAMQENLSSEGVT